MFSRERRSRDLCLVAAELGCSGRERTMAVSGLPSICSSNRRRGVCQTLVTATQDHHVAGVVGSVVMTRVHGLDSVASSRPRSLREDDPSQASPLRLTGSRPVRKCQYM
eukprot:694704-Rhodomonas_salina.8